MYMFGVVGETRAHDYFEVISFSYNSKDIYNILRYVIARILRYMCNLHIKGNIIWEFGLNSWKI